jgi:hypothetical protein
MIRSIGPIVQVVRASRGYGKVDRHHQRYELAFKVEVIVGPIAQVVRAHA